MFGVEDLQVRELMKTVMWWLNGANFHMQGGFTQDFGLGRGKRTEWVWLLLSECIMYVGIAEFHGVLVNLVSLMLSPFFRILSGLFDQCTYINKGRDISPIMCNLNQ